MKKFIIYIAFIFLIFAIIGGYIRWCSFPYTLIARPIALGTEDVKLDPKYFFPHAFMNPIKTKELKQKIKKYIGYQLQSPELWGLPYHDEYRIRYAKTFLAAFKTESTGIPDFNIVSAVDGNYYGYEMYNILLIRMADIPEKHGVVFVKKSDEKIMRITMSTICYRDKNEKIESEVNKFFQSCN